MPKFKKSKSELPKRQEYKKMNIAQNWRLNPQRYTLEGVYDENGDVTFPPRPTRENRLAERYDFEFDVESEVIEIAATPLFEAQQVA
jgi:hypothetical protein